MVIIFREFIADPNLMDFVKKDDVLDLIYREIYKFVSQRLMPLKELIDKEEIIYDAKAPCTVIAFLEMNTVSVLKFSGYTKELTIKMVSCFSKTDLDFLMERIELLRHAMNN